jgi:hypothetical protein
MPVFRAFLSGAHSAPPVNVCRENGRDGPSPLFAAMSAGFFPPVSLRILRLFKPDVNRAPPHQNSMFAGTDKRK